jgi:hypothetical protein
MLESDDPQEGDNMGKINFGRVLLGGLVAGVVLNIGEVVLNDVLFGAQMHEWLVKRNVGDPGGAFIAVATGLTLVLGIVMVLLYAMIRPRLGAGPKTAVVAAVLLWFGICIYSGIITGIILEVPPIALLIGSSWCLVEYILGAIVGAWLYKEA